MQSNRDRDQRWVTLYDDDALKYLEAWHGGQNDPLYAIMSSGGANYAWVFEDAIANVDADLSRVKKLGRGKYQLGKGTFTKKEIDELHAIRDALSMALYEETGRMTETSKVEANRKSAAAYDFLRWMAGWAITQDEGDGWLVAYKMPAVEREVPGEQICFMRQAPRIWHAFYRERATGSATTPGAALRGGLGDVISTDREMRQYCKKVLSAPRELVAQFDGLYEAQVQCRNEMRESPRMSEVSRVVADFDSLDDLIEHARKEGATHVLHIDDEIHLYFRRADGKYEKAEVWQKDNYWHTQGPASRAVVSRLPQGAEPVDGEARANETSRGSYTHPVSKWTSPEGAYKAGYRDGKAGRPLRKGFIAWPGHYEDGYRAGSVDIGRSSGSARTREARRPEITGPGPDGIYHYRGASIELSNTSTRHWWATVRFKHQEIDFEAQSSDEALEKAKDWIDAAPEWPRDFHGRTYERDARRR